MLDSKFVNPFSSFPDNVRPPFGADPVPHFKTSTMMFCPTRCSDAPLLFANFKSSNFKFKQKFHYEAAPEKREAKGKNADSTVAVKVEAEEMPIY